MTRYRLNSPDVIEETVDGEVLIVNTVSGVYYSLNGTGAYVWNALLAGHAPAEVAAAYAEDAADAAPAAVAAALEHFAQQLEDEQLLLPSDVAAGTPMPPQPAEPFSVPALQRFTDMQELLLVDPIHEVDPQVGWPQRPDSN